MFKRNIIFALLASFFLLAGCNTNTNSDSSSHKNFEFTILKAGSADAIFLQTENHNVIIDCGEKDDGDKLVDLLREKDVSTIDYLFITHFDKDHAGGFKKVVESTNINNIIVSDYESSGSEYKKYLKTIEENNLTATALKNDTSFLLDDVFFEVSVPKQHSYPTEDNDFSLVVSVTHGKNKFLFAGDAEEERIVEIATEFNSHYDFIKIPHHGRYNKNTKLLINTTTPDYAAICDSNKNPADKKTTALLEQNQTKIYSSKDGNITVFSNGNEINISQ